jgi:hypothetical protein
MHGFSDGDLYARSGGWFDGGIYYLNGGQSGELTYAYQSPQGEKISSVAIDLTTYFEASSWVYVSYSTNGTDWTSLGYSYPAGYGQAWSLTFSPDSNLVYVKYSGKNEGSAAYQFQLWNDKLTFTTVPEPTSILLGLVSLGLFKVTKRKRAFKS